MTLPLTGSVLTQYNNLPCVPPSTPLGDTLNSLYTATLPGQLVGAYKSVDESISQSTVLQNDDALFGTLPVGAWAFRLFLFLDLQDGSGIKLALSGAAVFSTLKARINVFADNGTNVASGLVTALDVAVEHGGAGAGPHWATIDGSIAVTTAGVLGLAWAQNASRVLPAIVQAGSFLSSSKLG